jgi:hypothetical protein
VHEAVSRVAPIDDERFDGVEQVGAWWDRTNQREYDIATTTRAGAVAWLGTIKWRPNEPVSAGEVAALAEGRADVPGAAHARLLAVCPSGSAQGAGADMTLTAADILASWRPR